MKLTFAQRYQHYDNADSLVDHPEIPFQCFVKDHETNGHFRVPTPDDIRSGRSDAHLRNWAYREYKMLKQKDEGTFSRWQYAKEMIADFVCEVVFNWTGGKVNLTPGQKTK